MQTMTANNPNLYLVNINEYINLAKFCQFVPKILSGNEILTPVKGHNSTNLRKMTGNNSNLDLVNINDYI